MKRLIWWLCAIAWSFAWYGIYVAYQDLNHPQTMEIKYFHIQPGSCTTDTDCMNKFGGDGGLEPIREVRL